MTNAIDFTAPIDYTAHTPTELDAQLLVLEAAEADAFHHRCLLAEKHGPRSPEAVEARKAQIALQEQVNALGSLLDNQTRDGQWTCWCGETAEYVNAETDATAASPCCVAHVKDSYTPLPTEQAEQDELVVPEAGAHAGITNHPNGVTCWVDSVDVAHAWTTTNAQFTADLRTCPTADHRGAALHHWTWTSVSRYTPSGANEVLHFLTGGSLRHVDPFTVDPAHPLHAHVQAIIERLGAVQQAPVPA